VPTQVRTLSPALRLKMVKRTGPTNERLRNLINELKKLSASQKAKIWKRIALDLEKPARQRRTVNILKINIHAKKCKTVIVPGKVLGDGELQKDINVAAWQFSESAKNKLKDRAITIETLIKQNPKGKEVMILG